MAERCSRWVGGVLGLWVGGWVECGVAGIGVGVGLGLVYGCSLSEGTLVLFGVRLLSVVFGGRLIFVVYFRVARLGGVGGWVWFSLSRLCGFGGLCLVAGCVGIVGRRCGGLVVVSYSSGSVRLRRAAVVRWSLVEIVALRMVRTGMRVAGFWWVVEAWCGGNCRVLYGVCRVGIAGGFCAVLGGQLGCAVLECSVRISAYNFSIGFVYFVVHAILSVLPAWWPELGGFCLLFYGVLAVYSVMSRVLLLPLLLRSPLRCCGPSCRVVQVLDFSVSTLSRRLGGERAVLSPLERLAFLSGVPPTLSRPGGGMFHRRRALALTLPGGDAICGGVGSSGCWSFVGPNFAERFSGLVFGGPPAGGCGRTYEYAVVRLAGAKPSGALCLCLDLHSRSDALDYRSLVPSFIFLTELQVAFCGQACIAVVSAVAKRLRAGVGLDKVADVAQTGSSDSVDIGMARVFTAVGCGLLVGWGGDCWHLRLVGYYAGWDEVLIQLRSARRFVPPSECGSGSCEFKAGGFALWAWSSGVMVALLYDMIEDDMDSLHGRFLGFSVILFPPSAPFPFQTKIAPTRVEDTISCRFNFGGRLQIASLPYREGYSSFLGFFQNRRYDHLLEKEFRYLLEGMHQSIRDLFKLKVDPSGSNLVDPDWTCHLKSLRIA
ncbi:hypothetical protein Tco_0031800 [Tanacetum coccineum]